MTDIKDKDMLQDAPQSESSFVPTVAPGQDVNFDVEKEQKRQIERALKEINYR